MTRDYLIAQWLLERNYADYGTKASKIDMTHALM